MDDGDGSVVKRVNPRCRVVFIVGDPVGVTRSPIDFPGALARVRETHGARAHDAAAQRVQSGEGGESRCAAPG